MRYQVTHRTFYRYQTEVTDSYGQLVLLPRTFAGQQCEESRVVIGPTPDDYRERADHFGNRAAFFAIHSPHRSLEVTATSVVDTSGRGLAPLLPVDAWEQIRDRLHNGAPGLPDAAVVEAREFTLDSPLAGASPELSDYARPSFTPGRPVLDALADLSQRIHTDFTYEQGVTTVSTSAVEVLGRRRGVCQDFAHLMIGCLRSVGLAARYASGYLETHPPPGQPRLAGADASHAWASLFVGATVGWVDVDPTNRQFVDGRYITTAWGRDYTDIPPLKGVIFTEGVDHELDVDVDVVALGSAEVG